MFGANAMQTQSVPVSASFSSESAAAGEPYSPRLPTHPQEKPLMKPSDFGSCGESAATTLKSIRQRDRHHHDADCEVTMFHEKLPGIVVLE